MQPRLTPCAIALLSFALQVLAADSSWHSKAWVRKYPCDQSSAKPPSLEFDPFWIDSFRGAWTTRDGASKLELDILTVYNESYFDCEDIDVLSFKDSLDFQVLGSSIGARDEFWSECPLPITDALTPLGKDRFSAYHLTYTFPSAHRLQTLTSTLRFNRPNGTQLDCGVVKITPDLGKPVSAALTYTPIGVLFLTAISSWRTHLSSLDYSSILEHGSVFAGQGPLWAVILELTSYLRHLQFVFISASMSIEYPGFYVPAVSKIAWSCLLFWRGPVDHGYSHPGIDGGMCVSNASYGMQFMPQMLGYPNAINTLFNSLINLAVLVVPAFLLLALFVLKMRQPTQVETLGFRPIAKLTAGISAGITLCFFSVPLLSYMAYDLILVGYLPSYRIALAVAMLLILIGAHSFLTRQVDSELRYKPLSDLPGHEREGNYYHRLWRATNVQLPHLVPLLQAIAVGSLQDYPLAQVSILATTELMIPIQMAYTGNFTTTTTLFSVVRTISILLCAVLVSAISESTRQRVGYAMLALHGLVVLPGWVIRSGWYLYRSFQSEQDLPQTAFPTRNDGSSDLSPPVSSSDLLTYPASPAGYFQKGYHPEMPWQHHLRTTSSFYRHPRSRTVTPIQNESQASSSSNPPIELTPVAPVGDADFDIKLALSQVSPRVGVDYSIREVDRYYGVQPELGDSTIALAGDLPPTMEQNRKSKHAFFNNRLSGFSMNLKWFQKKEQEQGFQVVRPPRPPPTGVGTPGTADPPIDHSQVGRVRNLS